MRPFTGGYFSCSLQELDEDTRTHSQSYSRHACPRNGDTTRKPDAVPSILRSGINPQNCPFTRCHIRTNPLVLFPNEKTRTCPSKYPVATLNPKSQSQIGLDPKHPNSGKIPFTKRSYLLSLQIENLPHVEIYNMIEALFSNTF